MSQNTPAPAATERVTFVVFEPSCGEHSSVGGYEWDRKDAKRIHDFYETFIADPLNDDDNIALYEIDVAAYFSNDEMEALIEIDFVDDWPGISPTKSRRGTHAQSWIVRHGDTDVELTDPISATLAYDSLATAHTDASHVELLHREYQSGSDEMESKLIRTTNQPTRTIAVPDDVMRVMNDALVSLLEDVPDESADPWASIDAPAATSRTSSREGYIQVLTEAIAATRQALDLPALSDDTLAQYR